LPQYFVTRPIFASVLSIVIVLLGVAAMLRLPISEYPEVVPPTIAINATYPGANPETIADTVAGPLEKEMTGIDGMLYLFSQATPDGVMQLTLTFKIGTDLDKALIEVQNRVQRATPRLPDEVRRLGVQANKATRNILMVMHLTADEGSMDLLSLANYARLNVKDEIARLPGVSDVPVFGAGEYSMRVWLDPERMSARSLQPSDVVQAIREQNIQVAPGSLGQQPVVAGTPFEVMLSTQGRLSEPTQFAEIIVRRGQQGQIVRLKDVARVELGANTYALRALLDNKLAAAMPIIQAPGSNALAVSNAVRAKLEELSKAFPPGVHYAIPYDPTQFIRSSIEAVVHTLVEAVILVVLVVILFLQTWRATIIPLIAVPVSIIGTFAVMLPLGFTINALSLFGLVLAIGIVVDDAIVVVENVERNIDEGLDPLPATRKAMREVSGPILATALVLCSVFIPTALISGLTGRFYQQFALTIAISTAISAFNSLTLSPALAALLLRRREHGSRPGGALFGWFFAGFNRLFSAASNGYVGATRRVIRVSALALLIYGGLLVLTGWTFEKIPTSFIPAQDKGYLIAVAQLPEGASLDRTEKVVRQIGDIVMKHPGVDGAVSFVGLSINGFTSVSNAGLVFVRLKPYEERGHDPNLYAPKIAADLQMKLFGVPDALAFCVNVPAIIGLGRTGDFTMYVEDRSGAGLQKLHEGVQTALAEARKRPEFNSALGGRVYTYATLSVPRVSVDVDREKVLAQGLRLTDVYDALQGYFGIIYANDFNRFGRTWQVNVQADAPYRMNQADLQRIKVRNGAGEMVPISAFITTREIAGPDRAVHYNTYPAIDLNGLPAFGFTGDQAQAAISEELKKNLPSGMTFEWTDLVYQQILSGNTAVYIFPVCVLLVLLVLAAFYESLLLPLAIVLIVPMCLLSAMGGVWLTGKLYPGFQADNNIMTQIGLIVLVGLACKNAILIVEFAREAEIMKGLDPLSAALDACRLRLRPILMTSLAFIMGVLPLVTAHGAGAEVRSATGVAVFFGMIGVTGFGLLLTPVFYVVLRKLRGGKLKSHLHDDEEAAAPVPAQH
jgi:multidrug efflux pump